MFTWLQLLSVRDTIHDSVPISDQMHEDVIGEMNEQQSSTEVQFFYQPNWIYDLQGT